VEALAAFGVPLSIDSWKPEVTRRALQHGATVINAADGMQTDEMWQVAADFRVPIVLPFLSGPNPREMEMVRADPVQVMLDFFTEQLAVADRYDLRSLCILDPGTGFAPSNWPWEERYLYQKQVYSNLEALRTFGLPLYIALPWKETAQHDELLEIVLKQRPEYGRVHYPEKVRRVERELGLS
jgi:dihydropteroate synthase